MIKGYLLLYYNKGPMFFIRGYQLQTLARLWFRLSAIVLVPCGYCGL